MTRGGTRREPGELENEILVALWAGGRPMTPADVVGALDGTLAYTTVMTTLARLAEKGLVERARSGRGYAYAPRVREADLAARRFRALLARGHDRHALLQGFVSELSAEEQRALRALLDEDADEAGDP